MGGSSLAATSSQLLSCTVTGVLAGDVVSVQLPGTAASSTVGANGLFVFGTSAGTDVIYFNIFNLTGAATTSFKQATTSVLYTILR